MVDDTVLGDLEAITPDPGEGWAPDPPDIDPSAFDAAAGLGLAPDVEVAQADTDGDGYLERTSLPDGTVLVTDPATGLVVDVLPAGNPFADSLAEVPAAEPRAIEVAPNTSQPNAAPSDVDSTLRLAGPDGTWNSLPGIDTDGDGIVDAATLDLSGDGVDDTAVFDTNRDGVADTVMVDADGDARPDRVLHDVSGRGDWQDTTSEPATTQPTSEQPATQPVATQPTATQPAPSDGVLEVTLPSGERQSIEGRDTDGDGRVDAASFDSTGDGVDDTFIFDDDRDGVGDMIIQDTNADNRAEKVLSDEGGTGNWQDVTESFNASQDRHRSEGEPATQPATTEPVATQPATNQPGMAPATVDPAGDPQVSQATGVITLIAQDGTPGQVTGTDTNADGIADTAVLDSSGDGKPDTWVIDADQDGKADTFKLDKDGDGTPDVVLIDQGQTGAWTQQGVETSPGPDGVVPEYQTVFPDPANGDIFQLTLAHMDRDAERLWWDMTGEPVPLASDGTPIHGDAIYMKLAERQTDPDMMEDLARMSSKYLALANSGIYWGSS